MSRDAPHVGWLLKAWHSPTITSWAAMAVRAGGFLLVLPVLAAKLEPAEFELWLLFGTASALVLMSSFGFDATFVRLIAYALAGRPVSRMGDLSSREEATGMPVDHDALRRVIQFLGRVFRLVGVAGFLAGALLGSLVLARSIGRSPQPVEGWVAWGVVSLGAGVALYGLRYSCILQGFNQVAVLRRWEAIFGLAGVIVVLAAVLVSPKLVTLVAAAQVLGVVGVLRNRWLARSIPEVLAAEGAPHRSDPELWRIAWPVSWRAGLTTLGSHGLIQASGIIYSLVPNPTQLASYLFCLRFYQFLYAISAVPFHAQTPVMARLRGAGDLEGQLRVARRGMRRVYATAILGALGVGVFANAVLTLGASVQRLDLRLWWVLAMALTVQLYGGMLGGLYGLANRVFGHHAIILFGVTYYGAAFLLTPGLGATGIALSLILGCAVAAAFAGWKTYRVLHVRPWEFEKGVTVPALAVSLLVCAAGWTMNP